MGAGLLAGLHHVYRRVESVASKAEPGLEKQPSSEYVSGGIGNHVPYDALSRQGEKWPWATVTSSTGVPS